EEVAGVHCYRHSVRSCTSYRCGNLYRHGRYGGIATEYRHLYRRIAKTCARSPPITIVRIVGRHYSSEHLNSIIGTNYSVRPQVNYRYRLHLNIEAVRHIDTTRERCG